jgi:hypothetical protein
MALAKRMQKQNALMCQLFAAQGSSDCGLAPQTGQFAWNMHMEASMQIPFFAGYGSGTLCPLADPHAQGQWQQDSHSHPRSREMTTQMIQNMPSNLTREMLIGLLDMHGFSACYDFVYLPVNFRTRMGFGYAIVNFTSTTNAARFAKVFDDFGAWPVPCDRLSKVIAAQKRDHWGLEANIKHYRNNQIMHPTVPDEYKPVLFVNGKRKPFPPPTIRLKPPKIAPSKDVDQIVHKIIEEPASVADQKLKPVQPLMAEQELSDCDMSEPASEPAPAFPEMTEEKRASAPLDTARNWRIAMRSGMWLDLPERRTKNLLRDLPISRWENASWRIWASQVKDGTDKDVQKKLQALSSVPCLLCVGKCTCLRLDKDEMQQPGLAPADRCVGPPPGLEDCFRGQLAALAGGMEHVSGDIASEAAKRRLCNTIDTDRFKRAQYQIWRRLETSTEIPNVCSTPFECPRTPSEYDDYEVPPSLSPDSCDLCPDSATLTFDADPSLNTNDVIFLPKPLWLPDSSVQAPLPHTTVARPPISREAQLMASNAELQQRLAELQTRLAKAESQHSPSGVTCPSV